MEKYPVLSTTHQHLHSSYHWGTWSSSCTVRWLLATDVLLHPTWHWWECRTLGYCWCKPQRNGNTSNNETYHMLLQFTSRVVYLTWLQSSTCHIVPGKELLEDLVLRHMFEYEMKGCNQQMQALMVISISAWDSQMLKQILHSSGWESSCCCMICSLWPSRDHKEVLLAWRSLAQNAGSTRRIQGSVLAAG